MKCLSIGYFRSDFRVGGMLSDVSALADANRLVRFPSALVGTAFYTISKLLLVNRRY